VQRAACIALFSTELRVLSTEHWGKSYKILTADTRLYSQNKIFLPQRRRGRRELIFCLSGDDDKQKLLYCGQ